MSESGQSLRPLFDIDRAERLMREAGIDLLLASRRHNVAYLTGIFSHLYWEYPEVAHCLDREDDGCESPYYFAALPQEIDKGAFVVAHENRAGIWKNKGWIANVKPCCDQPGKQNTIAQLLEGIRERGLESATIGVERNHLPINVFEELRAELPNAKFVEATPTLWKMRMVKTEVVTDKGWESLTTLGNELIELVEIE